MRKVSDKRAYGFLTRMFLRNFALQQKINGERWGFWDWSGAVCSTSASITLFVYSTLLAVLVTFDEYLPDAFQPFKADDSVGLGVAIAIALGVGFWTDRRFAAFKEDREAAMPFGTRSDMIKLLCCFGVDLALIVSIGFWAWLSSSSGA